MPKLWVLLDFGRNHKELIYTVMLLISCMRYKHPLGFGQNKYRSHPGRLDNVY